MPATAKPTTLLEALLVVQANKPKLKKTASNPAFKGSKYAPLDEVVDKVTPLLTENGLVWKTKPSYNADYGPSLRYEMAHAPSGEKDEGEMPLLLSKNDAQGQGSAITYARRYAICAYLDLVAEDDDDGARAAQGQSQSQNEYGRPATDKQVAAVKGLLTKKGLKTVAQIKPVLLYAGVPEALAVDPKATMEALTGAWASNIIGVLTKGPIPTGGSDVPAPADGDFTREPVEDDPSLPFDPSVPA
jgi:hypothetical protein